MDLLPPYVDIPDGELTLFVEFGLSNKQQDIDNGLKPLVDILQKVYEFNDNRIYELMVHKVIVPKGEEYIKFIFEPYTDEFWVGMWDE